MKRSHAILFTLLLVLLLVANNADFFFRQSYHEVWDSAANSLSVIRAKHLAQLYGPYSRYEFYHPGPALFYVLAFGEWLFYDALHVVPTPFQGQLLIHLCLMAGLFTAALSVFARWLPVQDRWIFLCVSLVLAILHFGTMSRLPSFYDLLGGPSAFLSSWSAHALVLPFLCLLTAGASVAAGQGRELPLLIAAGGFLIMHVAQPLFVGSTAVLAYLALLARCVSEERAAGANPPSERRWAATRWPGAAWRQSPRAHLIALGLLALFSLPLVLDLLRGRDSNMAAILHHLHRHQNERKPLARSLAYFLQFGAYTPYQPNRVDFGHYDVKGLLAYLRAHALIYGGWLLVAALVFQAPFGYIRAARRREAGAPGPTRAGNEMEPGMLDTGRFLAWAAVFTGLAVVLSLYWGTRQDGGMFYYSSWFNFAIYYFAALVATVVCIARLSGTGASPAGTGMCRAALRWVAAAAVLLAAFLFLPRLRVTDRQGEAGVAMHASVDRAIAADASRPPTCKVLLFPVEYWTQAAAVALQLERAGQPFVVAEGWKVTFGEEHAWSTVYGTSRLANLRPWYLVPPGGARLETNVPRVTLRWGLSLVLAPPVLELGAEIGSMAEIGFSAAGNAAGFELGGWGPAEPAGSWGEGPLAALSFRPRAITGAGVEISVEGHPFITPTAGVPHQRLRVLFNGQQVGDESRFTEESTAASFIIPAVRWNAAARVAGPNASLAFELPDAASPASLGPSDDTRLLGVFFSRVTLRVLP